MSRYIDADRFIEWLDVGHLRTPCEKCHSDYDVKEMIDSQQTAEVQEIVRCKDCKYSCEEKPVFGITDYSCIKLGIHCLDANDFCSYGAKMDEEEQK